MIDKICMFLTNKIRKEMPDVDDERAEVINYRTPKYNWGNSKNIYNVSSRIYIRYF